MDTLKKKIIESVMKDKTISEEEREKIIEERYNQSLKIMQEKMLNSLTNDLW